MQSHRAELPSTPVSATSPVKLGLLANWQQFSLLVLVNAFVGAMVGLERSTLPLLAESRFQVTLEGVERILNGRVDHIPEEKFYMVGALAL